MGVQHSSLPQLLSSALELINRLVNPVCLGDSYLFIPRSPWTEALSPFLAGYSSVSDQAFSNFVLSSLFWPIVTAAYVHSKSLAIVRVFRLRLSGTAQMGLPILPENS